MFQMPNAVSIMGRSSSITNSFVNGIIPLFPPSDSEVEEALSVLGMSHETIACVYCGDRATEWDHLRPLVKDKRPTGYVSEIANLVPACGKCNQSKGGSHWKDWMLGSAPKSPRSRGIPDIESRVRRLEAFEEWRTPMLVDFEKLAGEHLWRTHWENHARLMVLMAECQQTADEIKRLVKTGCLPASESHQIEEPLDLTATATVPRGSDAEGVCPSMTKDVSLARMRSHARLDAGATHFANINASKDVWWLDIPLSKVAADPDLNLLLYDAVADQLHHLCVPSAYFRANLDDLTVRHGKNCLHLELKASGAHRFRNVMPVSSEVEFAQFVIRSV